MIITKEIQININNNNKHYYRKITSNNLLNTGDCVSIPIELFTHGSNMKIDVYCCDKKGIVNIPLKYYYENVNRNDGKYLCSVCACVKNFGVDNISKVQYVKEKSINSCLEKFGVDNPFKLKSIQDEIKQTNLERYGFECTFNCEEIQDKIKQTNLERYGVDNPFKLKSIQDEIKQTNLERYGVEYASQNPEIRDKIKQTNLERYGVDNPLKLKSIQDKIKQTNLERYGFEYFQQNPEIRDKIKQTNLERYGVEYVPQNPEIYKKHLKNSFKIHIFENSCLTYQGKYELDFLNFCKNNNINVENSISVEYFFNKKRVYYPDFYYKPKNLIIEIKSTYIYNLHIEKNILKYEACVANGYNYILIIDKKYDEFSKIINS